MVQLDEKTINKQLTDRFPEMMEIVNSNTTNEEKLKIVSEYTDILWNLVKVLDDKAKH
jgi:hypothetical protein